MSDLSTLPQFEEGHVPVVGGRIHYVAGGEGDQTIVLLHKLGGWTAEWRWIMPILATRMKTIAVDLTGHGGSTMDSEPPFLTTQEEMAAQLMATLDSLGVRKAVMTGSSMGGCIAAVCAVMWPERVSSVITVGSALAGATTREELVAARAQAIASGQFDEDDNPLPRPHSYMERVFGMSNPAHMEEQTLSRKAAGRWINPGARGVGLYDYLANLPRITAPLLMLYGDKGNYGNFTEAAAAQLKDSRIEAIAGASAFPHQDKPEETASAIMEFLGV